MTNEELFDAFRQVVSERDQLRQAGDAMWDVLKGWTIPLASCERWKALRGIGDEPPVEDWVAEC